MYDPLALDRHRIDDERLRHRAEQAARHPRQPRDREVRRGRRGHASREAFGRLATFVRLAARPRPRAAGCADC